MSCLPVDVNGPVIGSSMPTFTLCARLGVAMAQAAAIRQEATRRVKVMVFPEHPRRWDDPSVRTGSRPHLARCGCRGIAPTPVRPIEARKGRAYHFLYCARVCYSLVQRKKSIEEVAR